MNNEMSLINKENPNNKLFLALYNKSYRLMAAVFVVLNLIEDSNQIKIRIKELALQAMSLCVELKDFSNQSSAIILSDIEKKILELVSLLEIGSISGLISPMNSSILKTEFQSFLDLLSNFSKEIQVGKGDLIRNVFLKENVAEVEKYHQSIQRTPADEIVIKDNNKGHKRKDVRKEMILGFVKTHPDSSIKDIAPNIRGCSEKTIQRELLELIKIGQVQKKGERRWSRYYVA